MDELPSLTRVVSSEVAATLLSNDLMFRIRDRLLIADVPKFISLKKFLMLFSVPF